MAESTTVTETVTEGRPKSIAALRREYERLAAAHTEAVAVGNKPEAAKTKEAKGKAFAAWNDARVADRHAKRDAAKANGMTPGVR